MEISVTKLEELTAYCVSRMEEGKGQDLLIRVWPRVLRKFPGARLYLIGEGGFRKYLEKLVVKLRLEKSIIFLGRVDDIAKEISRFALGVFPSVWPLEGFGIALLEAMSLGKPIICFDSGPYSEIVNGDCAILVGKANVNGLSEAVINLFSNQKVAARLGKNGRKRFNRYFRIDKIAAAYLDVLLRAQISCDVKKQLSE